jgi:vacuolar-type H+-ATPase subunit C/Vma6
MSPQGVQAYSLVHATVRALYSTMLTPRTWDILTQAQDFDAVLEPLSETAYAPYLEIERQALTPRRTEYQIRRHLADVYEKLIRLTPEPGRQLLLQLWRLYEVDNLKATLRGIESGASWDQIRHLLAPMTQHITLTTADIEKMVQSGTVTQAIEYTRHTPYYDTLIHALERYRAEGNLFPLEVALDLDYRRGLWQSIKQLTGLDHEQAMRTVGTLLDVDNLLWAIRYRVYHHLSEQEIINYTLPLGYRVHDEDIRAIAAGAEIAPVVKRIYPDVEGLGQLSDMSRFGNLADLELILHRHIINMCRAAFRGYPFHIGIPTAYLLLNEYEIRDLTVLIEVKASHLPPEAFAQMSVIHPKPEIQSPSGQVDQRGAYK